MSKQYYSIPGLEYIYLEGSYVLSIEEKEDRVIFFMDFVLQENHPEYEPPDDNEMMYCFKRGKIQFIRPSKIKWHDTNLNPLTDASGEIDYGNIDEFIVSDGIYYLSGEWGKIEVLADSLEVNLID